MSRIYYYPVRPYIRIRLGELEFVTKHKRRSRDDDMPKRLRQKRKRPNQE